MGKVKWIKITTDIFDDEKIQLIESMPDSDTIIVIWFKLLALAGRANHNGFIVLNENVPYTLKMLETVFRRKRTTIELAMETFEAFGMLETIDDKYLITNWEKHQNIAGLDKIREQNKIRQQEFRDRHKNKEIEHKKKEVDKEQDIDIESNVTNNVTHNVTMPYKEIVSYLNEKTNSQYKSTTSKTQTLIKARFNDGHTLEDFKTVIDIKTKEWLKDNSMNKFLRPETLFGTKFESYLNQGLINGDKPKTDFDKKQEEMAKEIAGRYRL